MCASNKVEFDENMKKFISNEKMEKSIIFEVFTDYSDESDALYKMRNLMND